MHRNCARPQGIPDPSAPTPREGLLATPVAKSQTPHHQPPTPPRGPHWATPRIAPTGSRHVAHPAAAAARSQPPAVPPRPDRSGRRVSRRPPPHPNHPLRPVARRRGASGSRPIARKLSPPFLPCRSKSEAFFPPVVSRSLELPAVFAFQRIDNQAWLWIAT
ncbi:hypothetical protein NL676_000214 [Syzygium grande]|nr:hypothetical protein NL676_000214 [Syzygium grande]